VSQFLAHRNPFPLQCLTGSGTSEFTDLEVQVDPQLLGTEVIENHEDSMAAKAIEQELHEVSIHILDFKFSISMSVNVLVHSTPIIK
jgi:hypothetical protein